MLDFGHIHTDGTTDRTTDGKTYVKVEIVSWIHLKSAEMFEVSTYLFLLSNAKSRNILPNYVRYFYYFA